MSKGKGRRDLHQPQPTPPPQSPDIATTFQKAVALHQQGQLGQAEPLYRAILKQAPDHFDALHLLGVIEYQRKNYEAAVELIGRALQLNQNFASAYLNIGLALTGLQRHAEALANYDRVLALRPDHAEALKNRGNALFALKRYAEALASYDRALALKPDHAEALISRGIALRGLQRHAEALASYDRALALKPDYAEAWNNRGNALLDLKRHEEALASYDRALALKPDHAEALNNRGNALHELKRHAEALVSLDHALALKPDYAEALNNRGNALFGLDRDAEALACYDRALALKPDYAEAMNNRGNALRNLERHEEALASCDRALALKPDYAEALNNRGNALFGLKRHEEALASFDHALALKPDYAEALNSRGNALLGLKRPEEALASYDRALALKPDDADALNNLGNALHDLGRHEESLACVDRSLELKPDYAEALNNRGNALFALKRQVEALASYDRALAVKPDYAEAMGNRGNALFDLKRYEEAAREFERSLSLKPDFDEAKGNTLRQQLYCCQLYCSDWKDYDENVELMVNDVVAGKRPAIPFIFLSASGSASDQLQCARIFSREKYPPAGEALWQGERYSHDRIRVAYLSADFLPHATAYLIAGLFESHDKSRFETTAISFSPDSTNEIRTRLEKSFDRFIDVRRNTDRETAALLRELEIDIAVDLKGYTQDARTGIFAFRGAPIQVNYLGYPGTMGADYIDYIIADRIVIPADQQSHYAEKVVYLPDSYQPNDSKRRISEQTPTRAEAGLPETEFVFCSFNNNYKIVPPVFDIWMRLLGQVEGSVLWLLADNAAAARNLRQEAELRGIAPDRLVFAPRMRPDDHLARHRLADLLLDTVPINAHTTASDALWAGLPIVTCLGSAFAGRVAASLLNAVGLPELIADNLADYEALALKLARDAGTLAAIRAKLAQNRATAPLFDTDRYRRHIESAYETMWQRYQRGEPPAGFAVAPRRE
jgi:protein O-GlcNAc transferase